MSVGTDFVSVSEGLCSDLILHIVMILSLTSCCAAVPIAYSSDSVDDRAIVACVLLP